MKRVILFLLAIALFTGVQTTKAEEHTVKVNVETDAQPKEMSKASKDSVLYQKLSADQLLELKKKELEVEKQKIDAESRREMPLGSVAIFLICALPFILVITIITVSTRAKNAESKRKYDLYTKSLEMGQTIPEHFFDDPEKKVNPTSNLKRGIVCLSVGLALLVYYLVSRSNGFLIGGIIPAFLGAGYLLVHFLEKPKSDSTAE